MKNGEKVQVRLHTGEVVEAVYSHAGSPGKSHWVSHDGELLQACNTLIGGAYYQRCRFVGPPCVLVPVGVRA
jgi:hypothetical protein